MDLMILSATNILMVVITVYLHYEVLYALNRWSNRSLLGHRGKVTIGLTVAILTHVLEIWIFAVAYYILAEKLAWGSFTGEIDTSNLMDFFYYSFTSYTTLGFGDIQPHGGIRHLTGVESLIGLVLVTWTASFLYLEVQTSWQEYNESQKDV